MQCPSIDVFLVSFFVGLIVPVWAKPMPVLQQIHPDFREKSLNKLKCRHLEEENLTNGGHGGIKSYHWKDVRGHV